MRLVLGSSTATHPFGYGVVLGEGADIEDTGDAGGYCERSVGESGKYSGVGDRACPGLALAAGWVSPGLGNFCAPTVTSSFGDSTNSSSGR